MGFLPEQTDLIQELSEYLTRGSGTYSIDESQNHIMSVTTSSVEESDMPEKTLFTIGINYLKTDESRGSINYVVVPGRVALLEFQPLVLEEGESFEDKLKSVSDEIRERGPTINNETTNIWAKNLVSYLSLGGGKHVPNFIDSAMGMSSIKVQWFYNPDTNLLHNFDDSENIIYLCQVIYETEEPTKTIGSILFRVVPQSLFPHL